MFDRLRRGQGEERDRHLALLLVERGLLTADDAHEWRRDCNPGGFGDMLVRLGRITEEQRGLFAQEAAVREVLSASATRNVPPEVREASRNTLARVGRYVLVSVLGRGGMGEVWRAWDGQLQRWVALKSLRGEGSSEEMGRFVREAHLASRLSHPGITRIYDVLAGSAKTYIAMEFVDGRSFDGARREPRRAAEIVRDAARAVHYAHEQGVIHRDLKPANLLESVEGKIVVADFGLARPAESGDTMTATGAVIGTPAFMPPEQARGKPTDRRGDVFGLGATLFSLVEGRFPYEGANPCEILRRAAMGVVPSPTVEGDLAVIVRKAMEAEPRDRYATAGELADDLDRFLRGDPILARPIGVLPRMARRVAAQPTLFVAILVGVALGVFLGARILRDRDYRERQRKAEAEIGEVRRAMPNIQGLRSAPKVDRALLDAACREIESRIEASLRFVPDYPPALFYRGVLLSYQDRFEEAEALFSRILELDPAYEDARAQRGLMRFYRLRWLPLAGVLDEGKFRVRFDPYGPADRSSIEAAARDFQELSSTHPTREYGLALTAFASGRFAEARDALRGVLERQPHLLEAYHVVAVSELLLGRAEEADRCVSRAIESGKRAPGYLATRAYARATLGRLDLAVDDARAALAGQRGWTSLQRFLAGWLVDLGRFDDARREYDVLLADDPRNVDDLMNRSVAEINLRQFDEALRDAGEACTLQPQNPWAHWRLGMNRVSVALARNRAGDADAAVRELERAEESFTRMIPLLPGGPEPLVQRGKARMMRMRFADALSDFEEAIRLRNDVAPSLKAWMDQCRERIPR